MPKWPLFCVSLPTVVVKYTIVKVPEVSTYFKC